MMKWECNITLAFVFSIFRRSQEKDEVNSEGCYAQKNCRLNGLQDQTIVIYGSNIKVKLPVLRYFVIICVLIIIKLVILSLNSY